MRIWMNIMGLYQQTYILGAYWTNKLQSLPSRGWHQHGFVWKEGDIHSCPSSKYNLGRVISGIIFRQARDLFQSINQTSRNRGFTHGSPGFPHRPRHHTYLSSKQRWLPLPKSGADRWRVPAGDSIQWRWPLLEAISQFFSGLEPIIYIYI